MYGFMSRSSRLTLGVMSIVCNITMDFALNIAELEKTSQASDNHIFFKTFVSCYYPAFFLRISVRQN